MKKFHITKYVSVAVGRDHGEGLDSVEIGVAWLGKYVINLMIGRKQS